MSDTPVQAAPGINLARYDRFSKIVNPKLLAKAHILIVGVGTIGRRAAIDLASMGVGSITLVDFDKVDSVNLGVQGWMASDVGQSKVSALGDLLMEINPELDLEEWDEKFDPSMLAEIEPTHILACVDDMDVRAVIFNAYLNDPRGIRLFADARMGAEILRVYHVSDAQGDLYKATLFPQSEAEPDACGAKATIYCGGVAGAMLAMSVGRSIMGIPLPAEVEVNLKAFHMIPTWAEPGGEIETIE